MDSYKREKILTLMKEILVADYFDLKILGYSIAEDFQIDTVEVYCRIKNMTTDDNYEFVGKGIGMVDAFFNGMKKYFLEKYASLNTISFSTFNVSALLDTKRATSGTDSLVNVTLMVKNSENKEFEFVSSSRNMNRAALEVTCKAAEYFINSELTFIRAYQAVKAAEKGMRSDLVTKYTGILTQMVENTSYTKVIENIKKEML